MPKETFYEHVYYVDPDGEIHDIIDIDDSVDLVNTDVSFYELYIIGFSALVTDILLLYWSKT